MQKAMFLAVVALMAWGSGLYADEVVFKNGDRLTGKVVKMTDGKLTLESAVAGTVTVNLADVETFSADAPLALHFKDGTVVNQPVNASEAGKIAIPGNEVLRGQSFTIADLAAVNPPPKPPPKWEGNVTAGFMVTRGNSETDTASLDANLSRRSEKDRTTLKAGYMYGKQKDPDTGLKEKTTDKWFGSVKYDYFFSEKLYGFGIGRVERDNIADLDLRTILGAGPGYQWVENDWTKFSTEAGAVLRREEYGGGGSTESDIAAHLAYNFQQKLNENVSFLHEVAYYPALDEPSDHLLVVQAELRAKLTKSIFVSAKVVMNRDSSPAPGSHKTDVLYMLGIGLDLF